MRKTALIKFSTQVDPQLLEQVRDIADDEGRKLQAVIEEALRSLVEERRHSRPRAHVMAAYQVGLAAFDPLYKKLAE
jgi:metal-responsive CopG/Arc/MetJ family transcriptional regulator